MSEGRRVYHVDSHAVPMLSTSSSPATRPRVVAFNEAMAEKAYGTVLARPVESEK